MFGTRFHRKRKARKCLLTLRPTTALQNVAYSSVEIISTSVSLQQISRVHDSRTLIQKEFAFMIASPCARYLSFNCWTSDYSINALVVSRSMDSSVTAYVEERLRSLLSPLGISSPACGVRIQRLVFSAQDTP